MYVDPLSRYAVRSPDLTLRQLSLINDVVSTLVKTAENIAQMCVSPQRLIVSTKIPGANWGY